MPELSELLPALNCSLTYHEHFLILNWTYFLKSEIEYVPYEQILRALNTMVSGIRNLGIRNSGIRTSEIWNSGIRNSDIQNSDSKPIDSKLRDSKFWDSKLSFFTRHRYARRHIPRNEDRRMRNRWEQLERKRKVELGKGREKGWRSINNDMSFFYYFLSVLFL